MTFWLLQVVRYSSCIPKAGRGSLQEESGLSKTRVEKESLVSEKLKEGGGSGCFIVSERPRDASASCTPMWGNGDLDANYIYKVSTYSCGW